MRRIQRSSAAERNPVALRLRELRSLHQSSANLYTRRPPLLLKLLAQMGGFLSARDGTNALRTGLIRAGFRRSDAALLFLGSKVALAVALPMLWTALAYATARPIGNAVMVTLVMGFLGFYLPTMFIWVRQRQRHDEILTALPDGLDLMVVCVEAGLGLGAAIQRVGQEMRMASPAMSQELTLVNQEMQTGISRSDALRNLAERTGGDDVYALDTAVGWDEAYCEFPDGTRVYGCFRDSKKKNGCYRPERISSPYRQEKRLEEAKVLYRQTILSWQEQGHLSAVAHQLECFAYLAIAWGQSRHAAQLHGAAQHTRQQLSALSTELQEIADLEQAMTQLAESLGEEERDKFLTKGANLSMDEAVTLALKEAP